MQPISEDNILNILSQERISKKIRQKEIAKHLGISSATFSRLENGKMELNFSYIIKYAEYLGFYFVMVKKI